MSLTEICMDTRPIRFVHRGRIVSIEGAAPTRSVLEWLREDVLCTGTKEGCAEGDCGACTVIVAELAESGTASGTTAAMSTVVGGLSLRPVNACIRFLPTLDGKALLSVEDLALAGGELHPVQQAMVECHGSQCGFCTPGFVMTMAASYEHHHEAGTVPTRQQLADELAGNLCRCTGYRPILDAGQRMFTLPVRRLDTAPIVALLQQLRADAPLHYTAANPAVLQGGRARQDHFFAPRTLDQLATLLAERPQARLLAGCTDIGLWVNKMFRDLGDIVYVGEVDELKRISAHDGALHIGAGATLEDAWSALAARWPDANEAWLRFAGPPVRHAGTMGGNVANGSPIGDSAPVLIALGARIQLRHGAATREMQLEDFYLDYMKNQLQAGEFVTGVSVPLPTPAQQFRAYKISKRYDCDISALFAALAIELDGAIVTRARFAFGGMAAIVKRARGAEAAVIGQPWSETTVDAAMHALDHDFTPLSDLRASADYRRQVARGLLKRLWLETSTQAAPAIRVWTQTATA
jgi:xanthine dehydrogenase small subunit